MDLTDWYGRASGAKLNRNKSEAQLFGPWGEVDTVTKDSVCFMDPPDIILPDADTVLEPSQSGTTCDKNPENIKGVYKRYLLKQMEAIDIDIQYKKLKMRKLELEIQQLQKNASRFTLNKDKSH
ncbi:reverse transcriptase [Labeo rohita]|uniref:Reverse transcriptase n=1 Tax=Labeo rohita TaxID=84645 RepID=A0A498M700_LABRO|nr:reverse transcriptase [Labeo rohita]